MVVRIPNLFSLHWSLSNCNSDCVTRWLLGHLILSPDLILVAVFAFALGVTGVLRYRISILLYLLSSELLLLSVALILTNSSIHLDDLTGTIYVICILVLTGAGISVGISILASYCRVSHHRYLERSPSIG